MGLKKCFPMSSPISNLYFSLKTDQTFPNFVLKSLIGFFGGIILTYLCFMFFVFQLSISLTHATIMSSIIGILLTLGLAFSYRIRCLVFLLIPQFFSRVGRYTLTCYALVLILTGPATNTLKNSEVLSESMACSQEQIKTNVQQLRETMKSPFNLMRDSIKLMLKRMNKVSSKMNDAMSAISRLVMSIGDVVQSSLTWINSVVNQCNKNFGRPYTRCMRAINKEILKYKRKFGYKLSWLHNVSSQTSATCANVKPYQKICYAADYATGSFAATLRRKLRLFNNRISAMLFVNIKSHHTYTFSSNGSQSVSQVAAGIVTEIRKRADPLLTWLSWTSCATSLFLLLIIFRAKYYQHMYETRSRFDNLYVTKELRELDLRRFQEGRDTVLPLHRREQSKYIIPTSLQLVASERLYISRSIVFMAITTFKLLIHIIADYSLYWILVTIRYHGRFQTDIPPGPPDAGVHISGSGVIADMIRALFDSLTTLLQFPTHSPITCLPNPYPPDLKRYGQIVILIALLWFCALFEPYGLRLRHVIMGQYRPERAKARALWLYNHILRTRGSFMKLARRKLHREYKYSTESNSTFRYWVNSHIPFKFVRYLFCTPPKRPHCLLCNTEEENNADTALVRCGSFKCPGIYCASCFSDIGELCTICLSPSDYGDISDVSLERGSSDDSDDDLNSSMPKRDEDDTLEKIKLLKKNKSCKYEVLPQSNKNNKNENEDQSMSYTKRYRKGNFKQQRVKNRINWTSDIVTENPFLFIYSNSRYFKMNATCGMATECFSVLVNIIMNILVNLIKAKRKKLRHLNNVSFILLPKNPILLYQLLNHFKGEEKPILKNSEFDQTKIKKSRSNNYDRNILYGRHRGFYKFKINTTFPHCKGKHRSCKNNNYKTVKQKDYCQICTDIFLNTVDESNKMVNITKNLDNKKITLDKNDYFKKNMGDDEEKGRDINKNPAPAPNIHKDSFNNNQYKKSKNMLKDKYCGHINGKECCLCPFYFLKKVSAKVSISKKNNEEIKMYPAQDNKNKNFKRRKKANHLNTNIDYVNAKNNSTRSYRLSSFLISQCWMREGNALNKAPVSKTDILKNLGILRIKNLQQKKKEKTLIHALKHTQPVISLRRCCFPKDKMDDRAKENNKLLIKEWKKPTENEVGVDRATQDATLLQMQFDEENAKRRDFVAIKLGEVEPSLVETGTDNVYNLKSTESCEEKDSVSMTSLKLKDIRLSISKHFLHLRVRNPFPVLKDIYTVFVEHSRRKKETMKEKNIANCNATIFKSSSCQCFHDPFDLNIESSHSPKMTRNGEKQCDNEKQKNYLTQVKEKYIDKIISTLKDEMKIDTCSRVTIDAVVESPLRPKQKQRVKVITKSNHGTSTDQAKHCDVSTLTTDWKRPVVESKVLKMDRKLKGFNKVSKMRSPKFMMTDGRLVSFKSRAQIIPSAACDILSPSRYLLESQKFYNELFATAYYSPKAVPEIPKPTKLHIDRTQSDETLKRVRQTQTQTKKKKRSKECGH